MSYTKQGFTSGQTLKADHLNYMESGIEAVASGIQIKKVVFTDRPSIYNWLLDNYSKVIYCNVFANTHPWYVKYLVHMQYWENLPATFAFVEISSYPENTLIPSTIRVRNSEIELSVDEAININSDNTLTARHSEPMVILDDYWSAMGIECTVYYFSE